MEVLSCRNEQHLASCAQMEQKNSKLSALKMHLGHEWAFYDTFILPIAFGSNVVHCTVSEREGGMAAQGVTKEPVVVWMR